MGESWGGLRIWDYADPFNPVLASNFDTVCSADAGDPICEAGKRYSVHNVQVDGNKAYVSGYGNGGPEFESQNAGPQDVWGIYKKSNSRWIYASDTNGGLYVMKQFGSGASRRGRRK